MKLGAQLYSLRTFIQNPEDFRKTCLRVKEIGYENVQLSGGAPMDAAVLADIVAETGMQIVCTHMPFQRIVNDTDALIREHKTFGCPVIGMGMMPGEYQHTKEGLDAFLKVMEEPVKKIDAAGLHFSYHNHGLEFEKFRDVETDEIAYDIMLEKCPSWYFLLDMGWIDFAGYSPVEYINRIGGERLTNVHFKDFATKDSSSICPCGEGKLDFKTIAAACERVGVKNALVEQDNAVNTPDPFGQMAISFRNLRPLIKKEN